MGRVGTTGAGALTGRWAGRGARGVLSGLAAAGLALTNLPLLALSVVVLALTPVPFLGPALVPWTMSLVRMRADLERRRASVDQMAHGRVWYIHQPGVHAPDGSDA
jgi:hypothetical protein